MARPYDQPERGAFALRSRDYGRVARRLRGNALEHVRGKFD
jgi:hypothetical protein